MTAHARIRGLLVGLPTNSMLLSICERLDPWDVVADMADGIDLAAQPAWAKVCQATVGPLSRQSLHRRRYYVAAELPGPAGRAGWSATLRDAAAQLSSSFGLGPLRVGGTEIEAVRRHAQVLESRLASHARLDRATPGEIRWLIARALRRGAAEPAFDEAWEPPTRCEGRGGGVLAPLCDAVISEGGSRSDVDRPRHRRYVRVDAGAHTSYMTFLAVADLPHEFVFPGGGGEWLYHVDDVAAPVDWCVRIRSVPNAEAQLKLRRQHRQLIGQIDEYDGEVTGAPPSLAEAIAAVDEQRASLSANPAEPELQATIIFSLAADNLATLEEQAAGVTALFEPHEYGIFRPTGGQVPLLRSMIPGSAAAPVCRDYTQFLLPGDLAAGSGSAPGPCLPGRQGSRVHRGGLRAAV